MTTVMTITLLILAIASLMCNAVQYQERRFERRQADANIAELAKLESELHEATDKYNNEVLHSRWAVGRIKDQQAVIDQLKAGQRKTYRRKEGRND